MSSQSAMRTSPLIQLAIERRALLLATANHSRMIFEMLTVVVCGTLLHEPMNQILPSPTKSKSLEARL